MSREPTVSKRQHRETVKKRKHHNPYAVADKIRKHHPYEGWLKMRHKMDEPDLRRKIETNAFADFLSPVMPTGQASKVSTPHPPPLPPPTPQKLRRGTQRTVTSASITASPPPPPIKELKYEPQKPERVEEDDDDEEDYDEDDFVEDEAREYDRDNVRPVTSPYLMPYVYKRRFLDTQYGVRKDGDIFMIGYSPIVVDTSGDITI